MKILLTGHRVKSTEEIKEAIIAALKKVSEKGLQECFQW
jgi:hypothetical protein